MRWCCRFRTRFVARGYSLVTNDGDDGGVGGGDGVAAAAAVRSASCFVTAVAAVQLLRRYCSSDSHYGC